jgi:glycosyltransferase involved in cell wall biosynthesis
MENENRVRVLQVVHKMHRAGVETLLMGLFRNIDRSQVQFDFLVHTPEPGHYDDEIRRLGGRIIYMPEADTRNFFVYRKSLRTIMIENGPYRNIHSHLLLLSGIILEAGHSANIKNRIAHSHSTNDGKGDSITRQLYRIFMRSLIRRYSTHMLAVSEPAGEWLFGKNCWNDPRTKIVKNAIELNEFTDQDNNKYKLRKELNLPIDGILVGNVGRFIKPKNHLMLLNIFHQIIKVFPSANLLLVGEGPLSGEISSTINALGLQDNVFMLGVRTDIPKLLYALDLFIFPSLFEGLGMALIEAQAAGLPCLAADTIPLEADLGMGLVKFLPLTANIQIWAKTAIEMLLISKIPWPQREIKLRQNGYDMSELAQRMTMVYRYE